MQHFDILTRARACSWLSNLTTHVHWLGMGGGFLLFHVFHIYFGRWRPLDQYKKFGGLKPPVSPNFQARVEPEPQKISEAIGKQIKCFNGLMYEFLGENCWRYFFRRVFQYPSVVSFMWDDITNVGALSWLLVSKQDRNNTTELFPCWPTYLHRKWPTSCCPSFIRDETSPGEEHESACWFGTFFTFPYMGFLIIPTDELIFFRAVAQPPTR